MTIFLWVIMGLSLAGTILNVKKKRICFILWGISNAVWVVVDFQKGIPQQAILQVVYLLISIWGLIEWRDK
jgi:nicotinamide riboside transporter PnuC